MPVDLDRELMRPEGELAGDERTRVIERVRPRDQRHPVLDVRVLAGSVDGRRVGVAPGPQHDPLATQLHRLHDADMHGMLAVGDGHEVYWEVHGNPDGKPAVVLHGGPGSGCPPWWAERFDLEAYRVVLFDQRGCGRSRPHAGALGADLSANTTHHLIADVEWLREHLGIERWLVLGGSWGATLGLAYAQAHPARVSELVLFAVGAPDRASIEWITRGIGRYFPAEWARFRDGVPEAERDGPLVDAYSRQLHDPDPAVHERAARDWCAWEATHMGPDSRYDDPRFRLCFARLVTHYWRHGA